MDLAALSDDELIDQVTTWAGRVAAIRLHEQLGFVRDGELTLPGNDLPLALFRRAPDGR